MKSYLRNRQGRRYRIQEDLSENEQMYSLTATLQQDIPGPVQSARLFVTETPHWYSPGSFADQRDNSSDAIVPCSVTGCVQE